MGWESFVQDETQKEDRDFDASTGLKLSSMWIWNALRVTPVFLSAKLLTVEDERWINFRENFTSHRIVSDRMRRMRIGISLLCFHRQVQGILPVEYRTSKTRLEVESVASRTEGRIEFLTLLPEKSCLSISAHHKMLCCSTHGIRQCRLLQVDWRSIARDNLLPAGTWFNQYALRGWGLDNVVLNYYTKELARHIPVDRAYIWSHSTGKVSVPIKFQPNIHTDCIVLHDRFPQELRHRLLQIGISSK